MMSNRSSKKCVRNKKSFAASAVALSLLLAGCGGNGDGSKSGSVERVYTVGISQFAEHPSLDNCREGFLEGLREAGFEEGKNLKLEERNAAADMGTVGQISDSFVSGKTDLICAIATPSAQSAYNAAMDTEIPVIYTAVTDPVVAELAEDSGKPVGNVTGTSDKLPVEAQLEMIREVLPEAEKIGILYTTSEVNSVSSVKEYERLASKYGFEIVTSGISSTAEVALAAEDILGKVDCLTNLTDNTVVNSLPVILERADEKRIPVFGSEIEQVKMGCLAAEGLDYVELGKQTGAMAAKVLRGEAQASELEFELISESSLYVNTETAEKLGVELGDSVLERAAEVFDKTLE